MQKEKAAEKNMMGYISRIVLKLQRKAADFLNQKTANWSPAKAKAVLVVFCLITGNASLFIAGKAIVCANGPPREMKIQQLQLPVATIPKPANKKPYMTDTTLIMNKH